MNLFDFNLTLPITDPTWVFFLVLIIILFAPMILGRLHIPHIIGMILAGVLIGEHGFHVLDRDSSFELDVYKRQPHWFSGIVIQASQSHFVTCKSFTGSGRRRS